MARLLEATDPPSAPPGVDLGPVVDALHSLTGDLGHTLASALPDALSHGLYSFLASLGDWLYDGLGPFLVHLNVVTQRPAAWTTDLPVVQDAWSAARWLALVLLVCLFAGHLAAWAAREHRGDSTADLADRLANLGVAAGLIQISLEAVRQFTPLWNAVLAYAADAPDLTNVLPGWSGVATLTDAQRQSPEGLSKLVIVALVLFAYWHALIGTAWWDTLLALMPLAIAAASWEHSASWFGRWSMAVVGSLVAQLALCFALRMARGLVEAGLGAAALWSANPFFVNLLLGAGMLLVVVKLASMTHAGISALHPFASVSRAGKGAGAAGSSMAAVVAMPFTGGASAATVAHGAAGAAANVAAPSVAAGAASAPTPHAPPMPTAPSLGAPIF